MTPAAPPPGGPTEPGASVEDAAAARRAKLILRTKVGGTLALSVAGLLWASSLPSGVLYTLGLAVVLSLWSILEAARMRIFGGAAATAGAVAALGYGAHGTWETFLSGPDGGVSLPPDQLSNEFGLILVFSGVLGLVVRGALSVRSLTASPGGGAAFLALVFVIALPLLALVPIRAAGGAAGLTAFLVLAKIGDIAGYYVGSLIGKRRPFPNVSPNKTVAGCVASLLFGVAAGALFVLGGVLDGARFGVASGLLLGLVVNLTAQAGDLLESRFKRRAQVKDSGTTFGPSGGMLDLVDSLLLSAPLVALLWPLLFELPT